MAIREKLEKFFVIAAVVAALTTGGIAAAAIPDSDDKEIHACRQNIGGGIRVIDAENGTQCSLGETPLTWNQLGPQGAAGPVGPEGPQGEPGPRSFLASTQRFTKEVVATQTEYVSDKYRYQVNEVLTCHGFSATPMELLSGGYAMSGPGNKPEDFDFQVWSNLPTGHPGWNTLITANYPFSVELQILCGKGE